MKFDRWIYDSSVLMGQEIERYPILDWHGYHAKRIFEYRGRNFTGKYYNILTFSLILFRHEFGFSIEYGHGETTPDLAKTEYHARRRARDEKIGND